MPNFRIWGTIFVFCLVCSSLTMWFGRHSKDVNKKTRTAVLSACILPLAIGLWVQLIADSPPDWIANVYDAETTVAGQIVLVAYGVIGSNEFFREIENAAGGAHQEAHETIKITAPSLSVLVIGESMRADGLGPQKRTRGPWSMKLDDRVHAGFAAWLPPVCASHDSTETSVPMLITGVTPDRQREADEAPTGLSRLHSAGYDVGWIASGPQGLFAGPEIFKGHGLFWHSKNTWLLNGGTPPLDEDLLPVAKNFISPLTSSSYTGNPKALVLHLWGSHAVYQDTYPKTLFSPDPTGLSEEELENLQYDHSNEYGAKTLETVGEMLDDVKFPAFAVYTSDHGDNLLRDHNGLLRHLGARTSQAATMVPGFVMWNKAAAQSGIPRKVLSKIAKAQHLAQVDLYRIWMALSGLDGKATVIPTESPLVYGAVKLGDKYGPVPCSSLKP
jgi:glucan phosphoethanolaminetransferase (alkaline phosphatase superfamily)